MKIVGCLLLAMMAGCAEEGIEGSFTIDIVLNDWVANRATPCELVIRTPISRDEKAKRYILERLANLLESAFMAFDMGRYEKCIALCDQVLCIDPEYAVAIQLRAWSAVIPNGGCDLELLRERVNTWKRLTDSEDEAVIPYSDEVRFPSQERWHALYCMRVIEQPDPRDVQE